MSVFSVEYRDRVAVITIDNVKKLNALNQDQYYELATIMNQIAERKDVYVTVLIGKGRFFSAYVSVPILPYHTKPTTSVLFVRALQLDTN